MSNKTRILIDKPRHNLTIRIHVWCRYVIEWTNVFVELLYPSSGELFEFSLGESFWIDDDPSLTTTKREIESCRLDTHPHRECLDLIDGDILVISNTTLVWTSCSIVLTTISGKNPHAPIIHLNWYRHLDNTLWREYLLKLL